MKKHLLVFVFIFFGLTRLACNGEQANNGSVNGGPNNSGSSGNSGGNNGGGGNTSGGGPGGGSGGSGGGVITPVLGHPRLWITAKDLPRLQSWASASNPI